jgi:hypothetical protein
MTITSQTQHQDKRINFGAKSCNALGTRESVEITDTEKQHLPCTMRFRCIKVAVAGCCYYLFGTSIRFLDSEEFQMKAVKRNTNERRNPAPVSNRAITASAPEKPCASPPTTVELRGVQLHFPFKPYACQEDYMGKVLDALHRSENALLESPTGTGKSKFVLYFPDSSLPHKLMPFSPLQFLSYHSALFAMCHVSVATRTGTTVAATRLFRTNISIRSCFQKSGSSGSDHNLCLSNTLSVVPSCPRVAKHSLSTQTCCTGFSGANVRQSQSQESNLDSLGNQS